MSNSKPSATTCANCGASASGKFCSECGSALTAATCPKCQTELAAGARFCNQCGTPVLSRSEMVRAASDRNAATSRMSLTGTPSSAMRFIPWVIAGISLVAIGAYFVSQRSSGGEPVAVGAGLRGDLAGGAVPDISNMSPRERAGRLYDRIMRYAEEGKRDSVEFFAPMAISSFEMLGAELDLDARYDYGRVAVEAGQLDIASAQSDTILRAAPNHLLGLALAARVAESKDNSARSATLWQSFMKVKDAELAKNLPEYQAHAGDIEAAVRRVGVMR